MARPRKESREDSEQQVRLLAPYRFHDDDGTVRHWHAGQSVSGSDAALLIERKAPVEVL